MTIWFSSIAPWMIHFECIPRSALAIPKHSCILSCGNILFPFSRKCSKYFLSVWSACSNIRTGIPLMRTMPCICRIFGWPSKYLARAASRRSWIAMVLASISHGSSSLTTRGILNVTGPKSSQVPRYTVNNYLLHISFKPSISVSWHYLYKITSRNQCNNNVLLYICFRRILECLSSRCNRQYGSNSQWVVAESSRSSFFLWCFRVLKKITSYMLSCDP